LAKNAPDVFNPGGQGGGGLEHHRRRRDSRHRLGGASRCGRVDYGAGEADASVASPPTLLAAEHETHAHNRKSA
jgi:hypothetical protein